MWENNDIAGLVHPSASRSNENIMTQISPTQDIRNVLQKFQNGYIHRDLSRIDEFSALFAQADDIELIGIGAYERGGTEWFIGLEKIQEIIRSDWEFWGNVVIDVEGAAIHTRGETAWVTTTGTLEQTDTFDKAMPYYLEQMVKLLEGDQSPDHKLMEASHFGVRRLRERALGKGHKWPFVISAVLIKEEDQWRFHTIHWSMPVD